MVLAAAAAAARAGLLVAPPLLVLTLPAANPYCHQLQPTRRLVD